jgi:hypothetical protein
MDEGVLYCTGDIAHMLGLTTTQICYRIRTGRLPEASHRVGGRRVFTLQDVERFRLAHLADLTLPIKQRPWFGVVVPKRANVQELSRGVV